MTRRALGGALLVLAALVWHLPAQAALTGYCDKPPDLTVPQKDRLLRFTGVIKEQLQARGAPVALIARSGLDLDRFGQRYSHAGLSLQASDNAPWSVRQLYYACDERKPRLFDQGLSGFVLGTNDPEAGFVSVLLLPPEAAEPLARAALDNAQALALLHPVYSANAYAFDLRYQNCNQWVAELMAAAWAPPGFAADAPPRAAAQRWLQARAYVPTVMQVSPAPLMWISPLVPYIHSDDHPAEDLAAHRYRVSLPSSLEAFVRQQWPQAERLEFCHRGGRAVVRRGWEPMTDDCRPGPDDAVVMLSASGA